MAVKFYLEILSTYIKPLMDAAGIQIMHDGSLVDSNGKKVCITNNRYDESDPNSSPILYPVVPMSDNDLIIIKQRPETEVFNPLYNMRHLSIIAIKMRKLAIIDLSEEATKQCQSEDDYDKLEDLIGVANDMNSAGQYDYAYIDMSLPNRPEIIQYASEDMMKGLWGLCVSAWLRYVLIRGNPPKQFADIDKSWKKIKSQMEKWDKMRKEIVVEVKKENDVMSYDNVDLSGSEIHTNRVDPFAKRELTDDDFIMTDDDSSDFDGQIAQNQFLLTLWNDLKRIEDVPVDPVLTDDTLNTQVETQVVGKANALEEPTFKEADTVQYNLTEDRVDNQVANSVAQMKDAEMQERQNLSFNGKVPEGEAIVEETVTTVTQINDEKPKVETKHSVFKLKPKPQSTQQTYPQNSMMGMGGFGGMFGNMNQMMGGMFGGMGFGNISQVPSNTNDMDLTGGAILDPYSFYQK